MAKARDAFRTISEVADWLDTPAHVLRFWESKFPQIRPVKRAGGRRYYRPEDMALLGGIKALLHDQGMTIKGVQKLLREHGSAHVADRAPPSMADADAALDLAATPVPPPLVGAEQSPAFEEAELVSEGPEPEADAAPEWGADGPEPMTAAAQAEPEREPERKTEHAEAVAEPHEAAPEPVAQTEEAEPELIAETDVAEPDLVSQAEEAEAARDEPADPELETGAATASSALPSFMTRRLHLTAPPDLGPDSGPDLGPDTEADSGPEPEPEPEQKSGPPPLPPLVAVARRQIHVLPAVMAADRRRLAQQAGQIAPLAQRLEALRARMVQARG